MVNFMLCVFCCNKKKSQLNRKVSSCALLEREVAYLTISSVARVASRSHFSDAPMLGTASGLKSILSQDPWIQMSSFSVIQLS